MSISLAIAETVSFAASAAAALLCLKLWHAGLLKRNLFVGLFLLLIALEAVPMLVVHDGTTAYAWTWFAFEAARAVVQILLILEMSSLALADYRGIARLGYWFFGAALIVASSIAVLFVVLVAPAGQGAFPWLDTMMSLFRTIAVWVLAFFLALLGALFWFPIELTRNTLNYIVGFSVYFGTRVLTLLGAGLFGPESLRVLDVISTAALLACLAYWWSTISREGERVEAPAGGRWRSADHVRLMQQLDDINAVLLEVGRK